MSSNTQESLAGYSDADLHGEINRRAVHGEVARRDAALGVARDMILAAANFTCIHDRGPDHPMRWNPYCSGCPVEPMHDGRPGMYGSLKLICGRVTRYAK